MPIDTGEWITGPRISQLPYDMRGIWLTMLCYMWESPQRGTMTHSNGRPYTKHELIKDLGIDPIAIELLKEVKLLAVDNDGVYYSPDIVKRERISSLRRNAGRKGGEITQSKINAPQPTEKAVESVIEPPPDEIPKEQPPTDPQPALFPSDEIPVTPPPTKAKAKKADPSKVKHHFAECVMLTNDEYAKLSDQYGEDDVKGFITFLDDYKASTGKGYKSDYRTILRWVITAYYEKKQKYGNRPPATTAKSAGGFGIAPTDATGAIPTATGASPQSGDAEKKDYSERF